MQDGRRSWLETSVERLDALYHKFGREGLRGESASDLRLFLASKQLLLRDAGPSQEKSAALELAVKDLSDFLQEKEAEAGRYKSAAKLMIGQPLKEPELEI